MVELVRDNWPVFALIALAVLILVGWLARRSNRTVERTRGPDVLDEGAAPAQRNQSLIDAPPAATIIPPSFSVGMAGIGEVIATAAQVEAEAASVPVPPVEADDLTRIKGLGPKLVTLLGQLGVTRYAQIAQWSEADIDRIDAQLGTFAGRIRRDSFVEQAGLLAAGDVAGFEGKFGKV